MPHGGKRPGAGAPRGNLNALGPRHTDLHFQRLADAFARIPEARNALLAYRRAQLREEREARRTAVGLFVRLLDEAPLPAPVRDRLSSDPDLFVATLTNLVRELQQKGAHKQTPNLYGPHNQNYDDSPSALD